MQAQPVKTKFCTTREAASLLGVSVGSIQNWVERGLLEAWKTDGGHRRVLRDSVEKLLNQKQVVLNGQIAATPAALPQRPPERPPASTIRRLRVLVIGDQPDWLQLSSDQITAWGMAPEVSTCDNAVAGLVLIGRICPDLLLVRHPMPGMDGFGWLQVLNNMPEIEEATVVLLSGLDSAEPALRGEIPPGVEVLPKAAPFDRLLQIAMDIASKKHLERRAN